MKIQVDNETARIIRWLARDLAPGTARKIDNTEGTFMPVHVDVVNGGDDWRIVAISHYWKHPSGDMMADPDMGFFIDGDDGPVVPLHYQQDGLGYYREYAQVRGGSLSVTDPRGIDDAVQFTREWMANVVEQQQLTIDS